MFYHAAPLKLFQVMEWFKVVMQLHDLQSNAQHSHAVRWKKEIKNVGDDGASVILG